MTKDDPELLKVRARVRKDLENLRDLLPDLEIITDEGTDYPFRVYLPREDWERVCARLAEEIDYTNFKDAVSARQGKRRHDVYSSIWGALLRLESRRRRRRVYRSPELDFGYDPWQPEVE